MIERSALARLALVVIGFLAALELLCRAWDHRPRDDDPADARWWRRSGTSCASGRFNGDIAFTFFNIVAAAGVAIGGRVPARRRAACAAPAAPASRAAALGLLRDADVRVLSAPHRDVRRRAHRAHRDGRDVRRGGYDREHHARARSRAAGGRKDRLGHADSTSLRQLILLRLPAAAPHLVTGIKLAVAYSVIGIVAGEFILATAGIGKRIAFAYDNFDNRTMYGLLLLLLVARHAGQRRTFGLGEAAASPLRPAMKSRGFDYSALCRRRCCCCGRLFHLVVGPDVVIARRLRPLRGLSSSCTRASFWGHAASTGDGFRRRQRHRDRRRHRARAVAWPSALCRRCRRSDPRHALFDPEDHALSPDPADFRPRRFGQDRLRRHPRHIPDCDIHHERGAQRRAGLSADARMSCGCRRSTTAATIMAPAALPEILAGIRVGMALTLLGTLIGELFASTSGIGFALMRAMDIHNVVDILAMTLLLFVFAAIVNAQSALCRALGAPSMAEAGAHISLRGVTKVFPGHEGHPDVHALGPIDLDIARGEFFSVVGPSGCGKSTLLDVLAGLSTPTAGTATFDGKTLRGRGARRHRRRVPAGRELLLAQRLGQRRLRAAPARRGRAPRSKRRVNKALAFMGLTRLRQGLSGAALRRHAPARVHRAHAGARTESAAARRAVRRARSADAAADGRRAVCASGARPARPSCSSPMRSTRPQCCPTGSASCRRGRAGSSTSSRPTGRARATAASCRTNGSAPSPRGCGTTLREESIRSLDAAGISTDDNE